MTKNAIEPSARRSPRSRAIGARRPATPVRRSAVDPATTLAADYLDHFNQAILLLELLAATPDCAGNFHAWRPRSHQDCLQSLLEEERAAALAAYRALDPRLRARGGARGGEADEGEDQEPSQHGAQTSRRQRPRGGRIARC